MVLNAIFQKFYEYENVRFIPRVEFWENHLWILEENLIFGRKEYSSC